MDPVAVMLVLTFIVMLATAAMTMPFQPPPVLRRQVSCPEDHEEATVAFSWDITRRERHCGVRPSGERSLSGYLCHTVADRMGRTAPVGGAAVTVTLGCLP